MKKIIIVFVALAFISIGSNAQAKFEPSVKVSFDLGIDDYNNKSFGAEFVSAYRVNELFKVGIGTGISYCDFLYEERGIDDNLGKYYDEYRETAAYVPLFVNGKVNFKKEGISPYLSVDFGYTFFISFSDYADSNKLGLMVKPAFGLDFPLSKGSISVEVAYKYQARKFDLVADNMNYSQLSLGVGYTF